MLQEQKELWNTERASLQTQNGRYSIRPNNDTSNLADHQVGPAPVTMLTTLSALTVL